jgi:hypothetical protein
MIPQDVMMDLATIGLSAEQARVVASMLARVEDATKGEGEKGKEKARARWRKWKEGHSTNVSKRLQTTANGSKQLVGERVPVEDKTSNLEIEPQKEEKKETRERASDFEVWYRSYPHKVQRGAAERAWPKARSLASLDELIAGVVRYVASKPADRPYQNPATWLNGKGWLDQPAAPPQARASPERPMNPTLAAAYRLKDQFDAVTPSEIEGHHPPPRLVAIGGRSG